jgi:hypothetical protein
VNRFDSEWSPEFLTGRPITSTGMWSIQPRKVSAYTRQSWSARLPGATLAIALMVSPFTAAPDPRSYERRNRLLYTAHVEFSPVRRRRITLKEACDLALRSLQQAEGRRQLAVEREARHFAYWEGNA